MGKKGESDYFVIFAACEDSGDQGLRFVPLAILGSGEQAMEVYGSVLAHDSLVCKMLAEFCFDEGFVLVQGGEGMRKVSEEFGPKENVIRAIMDGYARANLHICGILLFDAPYGVNRWAIEQGLLEAKTIKSNALNVITPAPNAVSAAVSAPGARRQKRG